MFGPSKTNDKEDDELFGKDDGLFGKKSGGLFSTGNSLFDEPEEEDEEVNILLFFSILFYLNLNNL